VLTSDQKGAIAETAIAHEAIKLGIDVYKPINEGTRYDLILDAHGRLIRVQCKWAPLHGDAITVRCCSSRRSAGGHIKRSYTPDEIDCFAVYSGDVDRCYFLPIESFPNQREIRLRLGPTRNGQRARVHWAEDYEFAALDWAQTKGP